MENDVAGLIRGGAPLAGGGLQHLAARIAGCAAEVEKVRAGVRAAQLHTWESPAGKAYRDAVAVQAAALDAALGRLEDARQAVGRRALDSPAVPVAGGAWPW